MGSLKDELNDVQPLRCGALDKRNREGLAAWTFGRHPNLITLTNPLCRLFHRNASSIIAPAQGPRHPVTSTRRSNYPRS